MVSLKGHVDACLRLYGLPGTPQSIVIFWPSPDWLIAALPESSFAEFGEVADFDTRYVSVVEIGVPWMNVNLMGYVGSVALIEIALPSYFSPLLSCVEPPVPLSGMTTLVTDNGGQLTDQVLLRMMAPSSLVTLRGFVAHCS